MSIRIVNTLAEDDWRHFVDTHPLGNVFHTPEMYEVFSRTKGCRPEIWAATEDERILALLLPVQITLMKGPLKRLTTRRVAYGSILSESGARGQDALNRLLETYNRRVDGAALFTELRNLSDLTALQPVLTDHGFCYEAHLDYLIDLNRPPEAIFQSIGPTTRKKMRRGLRRGTVIMEEVTTREQLGEFYDILRKTYQTAKVPLADISLFKAALDVLHPKRMIRLTLARVDGVPVASSAELLYKDVVYGWYGGVDRAYSAHMPGELLMWHILEWSALNGFHVYDFGGAGKPDEEYGVREFKAKFGGALVSYGRNVSIHAHVRLRLSQQAYQIARRVLYR